MFKIYDGRTHFWQWDLDCKLIVEDAAIKQVHFCNRSSECSLVCLVYEENGQFLVNVPNILLQSDRDIHAYAYDGVTKYEACLKVYARCKPADYVYTETEVLNYNTLLEKINQVNENIGVAVDDYLTEHPVEAGATQEQVNQINANTSAINDIKDNYAKKTDIPDVSGYLTEIPAEYVTESELEAKGYIATIPSEYITEEELSSRGFLTSIPAEYVTDTELNAKGYATTDDVATAVSDKVTMEDVHNATSGFVTGAYVDEKIAAIPEPDLSGYALKTEIPDVSGFITEIPAEYITESELNAKGYLTEHQDLSGYALKSEIPDVSGFQTEAQVNTLINTALGVIENGRY